MKHLCITIRLAVLCAAASTLRIASAEGSKSIELDKLPGAAAAAIKKWAGDAIIARIVVEQEGGATAYEALVNGAAGKRQEITVNGEGKILSTEEVIGLTAAPEAVQKAAAAQATGGKILLVERIVANDVSSYEIEFEKNGKKEEIELAADGTAKAKAEEEDDDEDSSGKKNAKGDEDKDDDKAESKKKGKKKEAKEEDDDDDKAESKKEGKKKKAKDDDDDEEHEHEGEDDEDDDDKDGDGDDK